MNKKEIAQFIKQSSETVTEIKVFYSDGSYRRFLKDNDGENFSAYLGLV